MSHRSDRYQAIVKVTVSAVLRATARAGSRLRREGLAAKGLPLLFAVNIFGELVAGAGYLLQASAIGDGDVAAAVVDKIARS